LFFNEIKNNKFRAWRGVLDSKFYIENKDEYKYLHILYNDIVNNILKTNKIPKPTVKQMSDFYHRD